ncbi:cupin domain-containing protein [Sphaerisporangium rubeum]|uniref:Putative monooxygenase n=1 Tax=Sphaerisporangium rubeum TaxID=321317 RepID=A0A7X0IHX6_9ACTN|nr:cupin domain-containing protein [Sphaerisporangium rubeum]MBB6473967.1 putative monooxygenase [Sphaerisporangium rubeum]
MPDTHLTKITAHDVPPNHRRGGDIRVLLSPKTVGSTSGFMGVAYLQPGEHFVEHYHPYSEEFMYMVRGTVTATIDGHQKITLTPGESMMIPPNIRHRVDNHGDQEACMVFHASPLAPRPDLGHVDTEHPATTGTGGTTTGTPR